MVFCVCLLLSPRFKIEITHVPKFCRVPSTDQHSYPNVNVPTEARCVCTERMKDVASLLGFGRTLNHPFSYGPALPWTFTDPLIPAHYPPKNPYLHCSLHCLWLVPGEPVTIRNQSGLWCWQCLLHRRYTPVGQMLQRFWIILKLWSLNVCMLQEILTYFNLDFCVGGLPWKFKSLVSAL